MREGLGLVLTALAAWLGVLDIGGDPSPPGPPPK